MGTHDPTSTGWGAVSEFDLTGSELWEEDSEQKLSCVHAAVGQERSTIAHFFGRFPQGSREYTTQQVVEQLGLVNKMPARKGGPGQPAMPMPALPGSRFILPMSECEFTINAVLDELQRDVFPTLTEHRPSRCTGTALQVCVRKVPKSPVHVLKQGM